MESKRNHRCQAEFSKMMVMGLVAVVLSQAAAGEAVHDDWGLAPAAGSAGVRPMCCTGCYQGCFSDCMARNGDELSTIDPFVCSAECFVHCIFSLYAPRLGAQAFCTAGCAVSRCSKISYKGHPNTGQVASCVDSCSQGCSEKHHQIP